MHTNDEYIWVFCRRLKENIGVNYCCGLLSRNNEDALLASFYFEDRFVVGECCRMFVEFQALVQVKLVKTHSQLLHKAVLWHYFCSKSQGIHGDAGRRIGGN